MLKCTTVIIKRAKFNYYQLRSWHSRRDQKLLWHFRTTRHTWKMDHTKSCIWTNTRLVLSILVTHPHPDTFWGHVSCGLVVKSNCKYCCCQFLLLTPQKPDFMNPNETLQKNTAALFFINYTLREIIYYLLRVSSHKVWKVIFQIMSCWNIARCVWY